MITPDSKVDTDKETIARMKRELEQFELKERVAAMTRTAERKDLEKKMQDITKRRHEIQGIINLSKIP